MVADYVPWILKTSADSAGDGRGGFTVWEASQVGGIHQGAFDDLRADSLSGGVVR